MSAQTRVMIDPTVRHAIRINCVIAVFEHCVASHATCSSNCAGMPGAVPGPRHRGDHDPVLRAANTRRVRPPGTRSSSPGPATANAAGRDHGHNPGNAAGTHRSDRVLASPAARPPPARRPSPIPDVLRRRLRRRPNSRPHTLMPRTSLPPSQDSSREEAGTLGAKRRALLPRAHSTHGSISRARKVGPGGSGSRAGRAVCPRHA